MKKLIMFFSIMFSGFLMADCNFTESDTLIVNWNARPDSENVFEYWVCMYDAAQSIWTIGVNDTFCEFTGLTKTTSFFIKAYNYEFADNSDTVVAFFTDELLSDIPYHVTASNLWDRINEDWHNSVGVYWYLKDSTGIINNIALWTGEPNVSNLDSTFISTRLDFSESKLYRFKLALSRKAGARVFVSIDGLRNELVVGKTSLDTVETVIFVTVGNHEVKIISKVKTNFFWEMWVIDADIEKPGRVKGVGVFVKPGKVK